MQCMLFSAAMSLHHRKQLPCPAYVCLPAIAALLYRCILHVIDTDASSKSAAGWLEDTSKVQKYVMSDDDYAKRENTYKAYKLMKQKVGCRIPKLMLTDFHNPLC